MASQNHIPHGDPCIICSAPRLSHRVEHETQGDPCTRCRLPAKNHRPKRKRPSHKDNRATHLPLGDPCQKCGKAAHMHRHRTDAERSYYIGIDGEGQGRVDHRYVMLAASDEKSEHTWVVEAEDTKKGRLTTRQCLDFILSLPTRRTKIFSFSFNYDLTKMLTDIDDETLYKLFRPELRPRWHAPFGNPCRFCGKKPEDHQSTNPQEMMKGPRAVAWKEYRLNLQGTKFTVRRGDKRVVVWDLFKFFQAKFVGAIKDWKVGNQELWDRMTLMKDKRSEFDKESRKAVREYCLEECRCMAELANKLIDAHESAGLKLRSFYGAGSSGGAMLTVMGIKEQIKKPIPEMVEPVARAFFGGRFENSVIGAIREPLYGWDISSAYPYQITMLPCLKHGFWKHTKREKDIEHARHALIRYKLAPLSDTEIDEMAWGPFPFRIKDGSSCYPAQSGGGWVWRDEYLAGRKYFNHVRFVEAWTYDCQCQCAPFSQIPLFYLERLRIGKEGPGIVIKLGCNSCYGKLAQSVGNAIFNSWIWAGIVTSGTRAQILDLLGLHKERWNMMMIATDGIYTREPIIPPLPKDTGTYHAKNSKGEKCPLGGWEEKNARHGVFFARPGVYFPLGELTEAEKKEIRGRGVGKGVVLDNRDHIMAAYESHGASGMVRVANVQRFCGAKTSISHSKEGYNRANHPAEWNEEKGWLRVKPSYGQWIARPVDMSFDPMPKRETVRKDGVTLRIRRFPLDVMSEPYSRALILRDPEVQAMLAFQQEILEQPDIDLTDYGDETK